MILFLCFELAFGFRGNPKDPNNLELDLHTEGSFPEVLLQLLEFKNEIQLQPNAVWD